MAAEYYAGKGTYRDNLSGKDKRDLCGVTFVSYALRYLHVPLPSPTRGERENNMQVQNNTWESEIEKALADFISNKSMDQCLNIYNLCEPVITKAFYKSFKDPYMHKKRDYEVQDLKNVFSQEAFLKVKEVLDELTYNISAGSTDLKALRGRFLSRLFIRSKSDVYKSVVKDELPGYPVNVTKEDRDLQAAENAYEEIHGREATDQELAEFTHHRVSTIRNHRQARNCRRTTSLDKNYSDDPADITTLGDHIPNEMVSYQPESVIEELFSADIDNIMKSVLTDREYQRVRLRIDNEGISEMEMAKIEQGESANPKNLSACQRSINRDLNSAYKKLRVALKQYKED